MQLGQADSTAARIELDAFANTAFFTGARSNGTAASPTALAANDQIGGFNAWGYNGTSVVGPQATFRAFSAQTWTSSHLGTYAAIATTPNNSTTLSEVMRFEHDGGVTVPATVTGGDQGTGTINAAGLYVNGVSVSSGPIYSNVTGGISMTSGTGFLTSGLSGTGCSSGTCTMTTPSANGNYRIQGELVETTAGSGGTCNAGAVTMQFCYKNSFTGLALSCSSSAPVMQFATLAAPSTVTGATMTGGTPSSLNDYIGQGKEFRAASGTAIQVVLNQTVGSNCSTPPVFGVWVALYGPLWQ